MRTARDSQITQIENTDVLGLEREQKSPEPQGFPPNLVGGGVTASFAPLLATDTRPMVGATERTALTD
jgi:hypothetical protein